MVAPRLFGKRILGAALASLAVVYFADYVVFRIRMIQAKPGSPLQTVKAARVLAIPENSGKISYEIDQVNPEQTVTCAHSIFPHAGYSPCWYVKPRLNRPIPM